MCEWCYKHGAGNRWYLNARNYLHETAAEVGAQEYLEMLWKNYEKVYIQRLFGISSKGIGYKLQWPLLGRFMRWYINRWLHKDKNCEPLRAEGHFGQVVPLAEAMKILEIAKPIVRINCACRLLQRGIKDDCCLAFGVLSEVVTKLPRYVPERGTRKMTVDAAQRFVEKMNRRGRVNTIWFGPIPYIGALCNCDYPQCMGIRVRRDYDLFTLHKSEYVAELNHAKCTGCRACMGRCTFGALTFADSTARPYINAWKCFGCGLCATACPEEAIQLVDRNTHPILRGTY
jgi:ferredoxin